MGFNALYRLLWRPLTLENVLIPASLLVLVLSIYAPEYVPDFGVSKLSRVNLLILICPFMVGFSLGEVIVELQHTLVSWTLPNLRRHLFSSVLFVGIITACLVTWIYSWLGGPAPWVPTFTSGLLWYSMGIIAIVGDVRDVSNRPVRPYGAAFFATSVLIVAGFFINRIAELYSTRPFLCVLLTMVGTSLCLFRILDVDAARKKSLVPLALTGLAKGGSLEKALIAQRRTPRRNWQHKGPITGLFNWIRAGEYENFASNWGGWGAGAVRHSGIAVAIVMAVPYLAGAARLAFLEGFQLLAPGIPAYLAMVYCATGTFFLQKGWLYPLSRTQLARLAYWGCFLYNAVLCGIMSLTFLLLESLIEFDVGHDFTRPLILIFIFNPVFQWLRLRYGPMFPPIPIALGSFIGVTVLGLSWFWLRANQDISVIYEAAASAGLVLLSQFLYRFKLNRYFRNADLV